MAKKYKSKPHEIQAFRFTKKKREFPDWFLKAIEKGRASVTVNDKQQFITIYGNQDQVEKAYHNDCVCFSSHGKLYVLPNEIFNEYYEG
jgi:hypothetical protein